MNPRIKELSNQAHTESYRVYLERQVSEGAANVLFYEIFTTRFAELIVRECIEWCDAHATINGTAHQIRDSIKQHFGVEE